MLSHTSIVLVFHSCFLNSANLQMSNYNYRLLYRRNAQLKSMNSQFKTTRFLLIKRSQFLINGLYSICMNAVAVVKVNWNKVVVRACQGAYFVAHVFRIFGGKFCFRLTCMMLYFRISVQLSVEPLMAHAVCNSQHA